MVNVECPVCGWYRCLGSVQTGDLSEAMTGLTVPFRVDYRLWTGGRAKGVSEKETLKPGKVPTSVYSGWLAFVRRIEGAYAAVKSMSYQTPMLVTTWATPSFVISYKTPRLVKE
ncbi:MAG: hypothetical protein ACLQEQ_07350 [Nitrososphaerales archaeon]